MVARTLPFWLVRHDQTIVELRLGSSLSVVWLSRHDSRSWSERSTVLSSVIVICPVYLVLFPESMTTGLMPTWLLSSSLQNQ